MRTICHDLGMKLGCGGCMSSLRRTKAGIYTLAQSYTMEQILAGEANVLPVESMFENYPAITLSTAQEKLCRNGNPVPRCGFDEGEYRVYAQDGTFLMFGRCSEETLYTTKSFFEVSHE